MSATPPEQGLVDFAASLYADDEDPVDTTLMRDGITSGLLHAGNSMSQVRVNVMHVDSGVANGQDTFDRIDSAIDQNDRWGLMGPYGRWPLTVSGDGTPYYLRTRVAAALSSTPATATYRVVVAPDYGTAVIARDSAVDHVYQATTTSSTIAWLTGSSQGTSNWSTMIEVTQDYATTWISSPSAYNAVSGADERALIGGQLAVSAWVFAKTTNNTLIPRLHGLHLQEFSGQL